MTCRWVMTSLALGVAGCGGSAPVISNLYLSPSFIPALHVQRIASVSGSLSFIDSDGDIATVHVRSSLLTADRPIANPTGATSGSGSQFFGVTIPAGPGVYPFEVWITDGAGHDSNKLHADLTVGIDGSGTQWDRIPLGSNADLRAAAWTGSRFVVVGSEVFTSDDVISWTARASGTHPLLYGVAWSGTKLVAVGDQGTVLTSPDGITWTAQTSPEPHSTLWRVTWAGGQFVATGGAWQSDGHGGWLSNYQDGLVLTSRDGQSWTRPTLDLPNRVVAGVAWSGGLLVAGTLPSLQPADSLVVTSSDGVLWTPRVVEPSASYSIFDVAWNGSQFLGVSPLGRVYSSVDAITWTARRNDTSLQRAVIWTGTHFVSAGWDLASSTDGVTWRMLSPVPPQLWGIGWSGMQCVAVGSQGTLLISPGLSTY